MKLAVPGTVLLSLVITGSTVVDAAPAAEVELEPRPLEWKGPRPPWPKRRRPTEKVKPSAHGLVELTRWPAEPPSPAPLDESRFATALKELCGGWMPPRRPAQYASWIAEHSRAFRVDPFLVAAFIYRQSRCLPQEKSDFGIGLAKIDPQMHAGFIKRGRYRYFVLDGEKWTPKERDVSRFSLANLRRPEAGIYFTAAFLAMAQEQCPGLDGAFGSVPHRHPISHLIWGDRVRGAGAEDRVFEARRRLIEYYHARPAEPLGRFGNLALRCPLDGVPRVVSSLMGSDRDDGKRQHKGIDFASTYAEPVRAVAAGRVVIAGLDRPGGGPINVPPEEAGAIRSSQMGPGGLFVMVLHEGGLRSAYMHLSSYVVKANDKVELGQLLGFVGKTGAKESGAHLHFELRSEGKHIDPLPHVQPYIIPPDATWLGRKLDLEEKRLRRKRRVERWRAAKEARESGASSEPAPHAKRAHP